MLEEANDDECDSDIEKEGGAPTFLAGLGTGFS